MSSTTETLNQSLTSDMDILKRMAQGDNANLIDEKHFSIPTLEDFYSQSLSPEVETQLQESLSSTGSNDGPLYYVESPYSTDPGYYNDAKVLIVRADPIHPGFGDQDNKNAGVRASNMNEFDGDTLYFGIDSIEDGSQTIQVGNNTYINLREFIQGNTSIDEAKKGRFGLRFLGVNGPEVPHYTVIPATDVETFWAPCGAAKAEPKLYVVDHSLNRSDSSNVMFVKLGNTWNEVVDSNYTDAKLKKDIETAIVEAASQEDEEKIMAAKYYKVLTTDESTDFENAQKGLDLKKALEDLLYNAEDVLLMIDQKTLSRKSGYFPDKYNDENSDQYGDDFFATPLNTLQHPWLAIERIWNNAFGAAGFKYLGFNMYGQDAYKRFLGTVYVKTKVPGLGNTSHWINVSKYLMCTITDAYTILPDYTSNPMKNKNFGFASDAFKLWTYVNKNTKIVDALVEMSKEDFDDRRSIQKELGYNFENLKDWTVMIGDCLFMVPPTSIRCVTQTSSEKVPLLRSRGSMLKSAQKSERLIEMNLYFNDDDGINGKRYSTKLRNGDSIDYYMNGLRTLIAMYKLTPFLPVENHYINKVLNIEAVSLVNLQVSTMIGYPRCIAVVLTLQEFNYHVYMPELPIQNLTNLDSYKTNLFSKTIDYETMRWYYQRPIILGEEIKDYAYDSDAYLNSTFGYKTPLQPMKFLNSDIEFYVPEKDYLDQQLQIKIEALNKVVKTQNTITDGMRAWAKQLSYVYDTIENLDNNATWNTALKHFENSGNGSTTKLAFSMYKQVEYQRNYFRSALRDDADNRINTGVKYVIAETKEPYKVVVDGSTVITEYLDKIYDALWNSLSGYSDDLRMSEKCDITADDATVTWNIDISALSDAIPSAAVKNNFLNIAAAEINYEVKDFFDKDEDKVLLKFTGKFSCKKSGDQFAWLSNSFKLDENCAGYKFLKLCAFNYGTKIASEQNAEVASDVTSAVMQDEVTSTKETIDYETIKSLKFVKYPLGDITVKNISAVFGNNFTKMSLKALDGYAPQYCGGQDTIIEITLETMDESSVQVINLLPRMAAQYARDYRLILSCWPLRINSEITKLLGVNEVLVENVDINTVQGQPGLFTINIRLMSVDRTARNKEALTKLDTKTNAGSKTTSGTETVNVRNYFNLKQTLAQAEIYPDLELPTLDQLEYSGFKFIRYMNREGFRIYPDPDFYFVYSHVLGSEMFKNTIMSFTGDDSIDKTEFQLSDTYSAAFNIAPEFENAFKIVDGSENAAALSMANQKEKIQQMVDDLIARKNAEETRDSIYGVTDDEIIDLYSSMNTFQTWDVSKDVSCMFREKKYLKILNDNDAIFANKIQAKVDTIGKLIDAILNEPISMFKDGYIMRWNEKSYIKQYNDSDQASNLKKYADSAIGKLFQDTRMKSILSLLEINTDSIFEKTLGKMVMAAADAASGESEFESESKKKSPNWQARMYTNAEGVALGMLMHEIDDNLANIDPNSTDDAILTPYCKVALTSQGDTGVRLATSLSDAMKNGISFGPFQTKWYEKKELESIEGNNPISTTETRLFLDPYYRNLQKKNGENDEELRKYKRCIMMDPAIATVAFVRNMLYWLKKLLNDGILLSLYEVVQDESLAIINNQSYNAWTSYAPSGTDIVSESEKKGVYDKLIAKLDEIKKKNTSGMTEEQKDAYDEQKKNVEDQIKQLEEENKKMALEIGEVINKGKEPLAKGKFFAAITMELISGNKNIYTLMQDRNYTMLNEVVRGAQLPNSESEYLLIRKFVLAMVGRGVIKSMEDIGTSQDTVSEMIGNIINERVYLKAADTPSTYIRDSFFDMIVNDKRGRMLRAFPTYYMLFVDEGREIGLWRLHDNFYNMSAIAEIQVTKSRKIAADTARIVMTNMFSSYTTADEDLREMGETGEYLRQYSYTWKDVFNSVFSPRTYYLQEEIKRTETLPVERIQLEPGARIHLRMGYGSDASELPIVFNGVVAEVGTGEVVEIICQGDGVELSNPITSTSDAEDVQHEDDFVVGRIFENWLTKGASPRTVLGSLLSTKGGWMRKEIYNLTNGRYFNQNPFGIVHFGDPEYKDIFQGSECVQNIYEASSLPTFGTKYNKDYLCSYYETKDVPKISAHIFGKSYWDIMHICAGTAPDYICSTVPFGLRSSIYYGMPRYYYAYDYIKDRYSNGETIVKEKRKPFQQYHIYTSYSDIIGNEIKASSKEVKTCAVGLYTRQGALGAENPARVGPMWVDFNIYPENQKTMTLDTQYIAKGIPILGDVLPYLNTILDKGGFIGKNNGYEVAWRITARALKDSIKDMYQGELIVIGDPTVKPYDKMWIEDIYEGVQGCCEVEAVVHNFTVENGYTTSVFADCVSAIDDRHEQIVHNWASNIVAKGTAAYFSVVAMSYLFATRSRPFLTSIATWLNKGKKFAIDAADTVVGIIGQEDALTHEKILEKADDYSRKLSVNLPDLKYTELLENLKDYEKLLKTIKTSDITKISDVADTYNNIANALNKIDPDKLIKELEASKKSVFLKSKSDSVDTAIDLLKEQQKALADVIGSKTIDLTDAAGDFSKLSEAAKEISAAEKGGDALKDAISSLDDILGYAIKDETGTITKLALENTDDIKKFSNALGTIGKYADNVDDIGNIAEVAAKAVDSTQDILKTAKVAYDAADTAKDVAKGVTAAYKWSKAAFISTIIGTVLEDAIVTVLVAYAYEFVERWMKNLQVLQIFPLKKNGKVMTAGINGHKGIVVGSPTEKEGDMITDWLGNIFRTGKDKSALYNTVVNLFASQDMLEIASRFRRDNDIADPDTAVGMEHMIENQLKTMAADEMQREHGGYNSILLANRITNLKSDKGNIAYREYAILDTSNLIVNQSIKEGMHALEYMKGVNSGIRLGHIILDHEKHGNMTMNFCLEGSNRKISCKAILDSKGKAVIDTTTKMPIIDLPFVRPDLGYVLIEIYDRISADFKYGGKHYGSDQKNYPLFIWSALRAGENTWNSTGYVCRIGMDNYDLKAILDDMKDDDSDLFQISAVTSSQYDILVHPQEAAAKA